MTLIAKTYWAGAPWRFRTPPTHAALEARVLRTPDFREVRVAFWTPTDRPARRTAVVAMHPRVDFTQHYAFPPLLAAGYPCLGIAGRCENNDLEVVHEDLLVDLTAAITWILERRDIETVVLLGNSGGGSLAAFYQAQAQLPGAERISELVGGRPTRLPTLTMPPADALVVLAAHRGQCHVLGDAIDPAVIDEDDPLSSDPDLDMYLPANGFAPPPGESRYEPEFVARYRQAQLARTQRLDETCLAAIEEARGAADRLGAEHVRSLAPVERIELERRRYFQPVVRVYRTMANLHYTDLSLDPSPRGYGSLISDRPEAMNYQRLGFARLCSPEAWLSTWSPTHSRAKLVDNLAAIQGIPVFTSFAGRDKEIFPKTDVEPIREAVGCDDHTRFDLPEAGHYLEPELGQRESPHRAALGQALVGWLDQRFPK